MSSMQSRPLRPRPIPPPVPGEPARPASEPPRRNDYADPAVTIARLVGPVFCAMGIGMLVSSDAYGAVAHQFLGGYAFIYFSGVLILLAGTIILNTHHVWSADWRVTVTLLGWFFSLVGAFRLLAPNFVSHIGGALITSSGFFMVAGAIFLAIGGLLTYKGYVA